MQLWIKPANLLPLCQMLRLKWSVFMTGDDDDLDDYDNDIGDDDDKSNNDDVDINSDDSDDVCVMHVLRCC